MTAAELLLSWFVTTTAGLFTLAGLALAWVAGGVVVAYIKMGTPEKASRHRIPPAGAGKARAARHPPARARRAPGAHREDDDDADRRTLAWVRDLGSRILPSDAYGAPTLTQALNNELPVTSPPAGALEHGQPPALAGEQDPAPVLSEEDLSALRERFFEAQHGMPVFLPAPLQHNGPWEGRPAEISHDEYEPFQTWWEPEPEPEPPAVPPLAIVAAAMEAVRELDPGEYRQHLEDATAYTTWDWKTDSGIMRAIENGGGR